MLAFLGAGYTPQNRASYKDSIDGTQRRFGETVKRGLGWLCSGMDTGGAIGPEDEISVARQALATLALEQAYEITNAVAYRVPAEKAARCLVESRARDGGYGFRPGGSSSDPVVTATAALALRECGHWVWRLPDEPGNARLLVRAIEGTVPEDDPDVAAVVSSSCEKDGLSGMFAGLALHRATGPTSQASLAWGQRVARELCRTQETRLRGCADGSWTGPSGRVVATASAVLTLEAYYRYASVPLSER